MQNGNEDIRVDFLAMIPCPLKMQFQEQYERFLLESGIEQSQGYIDKIENNHNARKLFFEKLRFINHRSELPGIIVSSGLNEFFHRDFRARFIDTGTFKVLHEKPVHENFRQGGLIDPQGNATMLCGNTFIIAVNRVKMQEKGLAIPKKWEDLLRSEYHGELTTTMENGKYLQVLLLNYYKEFGIEAVHTINQNMKPGGHASEIIKQARTQRDAPLISVLPYFFARVLHSQADFEIIWPEDGALVSPVTMLTKVGIQESPLLMKVMEFMLSDHLGRMMAQNCYPVFNEKIDNEFADGKALKWLGWEYIYENDLGEIKEIVNQS